MKSDLVEVCILGKTVGLKGALKLHNRSDFIEQYKKGAKFYDKFGNLLSVLNSDVNGGYEFDEYRWYRDGVLIPDENKAFYYLLPSSIAFSVSITSYRVLNV